MNDRATEEITGGIHEGQLSVVIRGFRHNTPKRRKTKARRREPDFFFGPGKALISFSLFSDDWCGVFPGEVELCGGVWTGKFSCRREILT